jgi:hypothetical protein
MLAIFVTCDGAEDLGIWRFFHLLLSKIPPAASSLPSTSCQFYDTICKSIFFLLMVDTCIPLSLRQTEWFTLQVCPYPLNIPIHIIQSSYTAILASSSQNPTIPSPPFPYSSRALLSKA